jgi:hypothetical protein
LAEYEERYADDKDRTTTFSDICHFMLAPDSPEKVSRGGTSMLPPPPQSTKSDTVHAAGDAVDPNLKALLLAFMREQSIFNMQQKDLLVQNCARLDQQDAKILEIKGSVPSVKNDFQTLPSDYQKLQCCESPDKVSQGGISILSPQAQATKPHAVHLAGDAAFEPTESTMNKQLKDLFMQNLTRLDQQDANILDILEIKQSVSNFLSDLQTLSSSFQKLRRSEPEKVSQGDISTTSMPPQTQATKPHAVHAAGDAVDIEFTVKALLTTAVQTLITMNMPLKDLLRLVLNAAGPQERDGNIVEFSGSAPNVRERD